MNDQRKLALDRPVDLLHYPHVMRAGLFLSLGLVAISLGVALLLPKGYGLTVVGDALQVGLVGATTVLALQNFFRSHSRVRVFWLLVSLGAALWLASLIVWSVYEVWYGRPAPDVPLVDALLFVKLVPFTAAVLLEPHRSHDSRFRAFGLLDVSILMLYSLYLYAFGVFAYRLIPGATDTYNLLSATRYSLLLPPSLFFERREPGAESIAFISLRPLVTALAQFSATWPSTQDGTTRAVSTMCL
jgi:hypothetical protein